MSRSGLLRAGVGVPRASFQKLRVRAVVRHPPCLVQHHDRVATLQKAQTVADVQHRRPLPRHLRQPSPQGLLRHRVQVRRHLVQHKDPRPRQQRPRQEQPRLLPRGQPRRGPIHAREQPPLPHELVRARLLQRRLHLRHGGVRTRQADIVAEGVRVHPHERRRPAHNLPSQPPRVVLLQGASSQKHLAAGGVVQPRHQREQRRLAAAGRPDHADVCPGRHRERNVVENGGCAADAGAAATGAAEGHVVEHQVVGGTAEGLQPDVVARVDAWLQPQQRVDAKAGQPQTAQLLHGGHRARRHRKQLVEAGKRVGAARVADDDAARRLAQQADAHICAAAALQQRRPERCVARGDGRLPRILLHAASGDASLLPQEAVRHERIHAGEQVPQRPPAASAPEHQQLTVTVTAAASATGQILVLARHQQQHLRTPQPAQHDAVRRRHRRTRDGLPARHPQQHRADRHTLRHRLHEHLCLRQHPLQLTLVVPEHLYQLRDVHRREEIQVAPRHPVHARPPHLRRRRRA
eukprot:Rhum_TRINITY_DN14312_c1_g1::Rhum_TRINITY_DN14312_c1_g1_i1::g.79272::m.79272